MYNPYKRLNLNEVEYKEITFHLERREKLKEKLYQIFDIKFDDNE